MLAATRPWTGRQWLGGVLLLVGIGATLMLAYVAGANKPPSQAVQVGLAALSILANTGASLTFNGVGRADPTHAQRSSGRLLLLARQAAGAKVTAEGTFESDANKNQLHTAMGMMSRDWSYIEDGLVEALEDWRVFHRYAVEQAEGSSDDRQYDGLGDDEND